MILRVGQTKSYDKNKGIFTIEVFLKEKLHEGMIIYFDPWDSQKNRLRSLFYILLNKMELQKWRLGAEEASHIRKLQFQKETRTKIRIWRDFVLVVCGFISETNSGMPISIKNSEITFEGLQAVYDGVYEYFLQNGFDLENFNNKHDEARAELEAIKTESSRAKRKELKARFGGNLSPTGANE